MVFSDSGKMEQILNPQNNLENILMLEVYSQFKLENILEEKLIKPYRTLNYAKLEEHLKGVDIDTISNSIEMYLNELDKELQSLMESLNKRILKSSELSVARTEHLLEFYYDALKDDKVVFSGRDLIIAKEYLTDEELINVINMERDGYGSIVPSLKERFGIDMVEIKESHNRVFYLDDRNEHELFGVSRLKKDCTRKFTEYVIGEEKFPHDCGGVRFYTQKNGDLYRLKEIIKSEVGEIIERSYRIMPDIYDRIEVRDKVEKAFIDAKKLAPQNKEFSKKDKDDIIVGMWINSKTPNGFLAEFQLLPIICYGVMETHKNTNHVDYKSNEVEYTGKKLLIENFMKDVEKHRVNKLKIPLRDYNRPHLSVIESA